MKKILVAILAICIAAGLQAKTTYKYYPKTELRPDKTVFLYVPNQKKEIKNALKSIDDPVQAKKVETLALTMAVESDLDEPENMFDPNGATLNINKYARFDIYFPKNPNGKMFVVCPGGGYNCVCHYIEGSYAADWLTEHGYTVAVVKYRLPNGHHSIPLTDVQTVFRYCREHQAEWGIEKVGVMGFSAGGHLAASASVLYDDDATRPDYSVLFYPVISVTVPFGHVYTGQKLIGNYNQMMAENPDECLRLINRYQLHRQVTSDTPPTFIVLTSDDKEVNPLNGLSYYESLLKHGVKAEIHCYQTGIHGFGFDYYKFNPNDWLGAARDDFFATLERWLNTL